jgi:hypothetical protein
MSTSSRWRIASKTGAKGNVLPALSNRIEARIRNASGTVLVPPPEQMVESGTARIDLRPVRSSR